MNASSIRSSPWRSPPSLPAVAHAERGFEVRDLAKLDRVSAPVLSPDGRKVVFAKRVVDFAANKSRDLAVDRGPVRARRRAAGAPHAGRLERQFADVLRRRHARVLPQREGRLDAALRDPGRRRRAGATDGHRRRCRRLQDFARRQARRARARSVRRLQGGPAVQRQAQQGARGSQGVGRRVRSPLHPPLGCVERRQAQSRVRRALRGRRREDHAGDAGRQRRDRRRAVASVRRHQRIWRGRPTASRSCCPRARPTARNRGRPTSTCTWSTPTAPAPRRTSPPPTRRGTPARCSRTTARRCTTAR